MVPFFISLGRQTLLNLTLMLSIIRWSLWLLVLLCGIRCIAAFNFTTDSPTQCDDFRVRWSGGKNPRTLYITRPTEASVNFTIDANAGSGIFTVPRLPYQQGSQIVVTLSDEDGFASGGTSGILTVGPSLGGAACNTSVHAPAFFFSIDGNVTQCQPDKFAWFARADVTDAVRPSQPVTIQVIIPLGNSFAIQAPQSDSQTFLWNANLTANTSVVFAVVDAAGFSGGSSGVMLVGPSNNADCLSSPTTTSLPNSTAPPTSTARTNHLSPGAIAGIVAGGIVAIGALTLALIYLLQKCRRDNSNIDGRISPYEPSYVVESYTDSPRTSPGSSIPTASNWPSNSPFSASLPLSPVRPKLQYPYSSVPERSPPDSLRSGYAPPGWQRAREASSSYTTSYPPGTASPGYFVHTDFAEAAGIIELPPQYSDTRAPLLSSPPVSPQLRSETTSSATPAGEANVSGPANFSPEDSRIRTQANRADRKYRLNLGAESR